MATRGDQVDERVRARRMRWIAAVALAVGVGLFMAACGSESTGGSPSDDEGTFLLPPDGVEVTWATGYYGDPTSTSPDPDLITGYIYGWNDSSGAPVLMDVLRSGFTFPRSTPTIIEFDPPGDVDELLEVVATVYGASAFEYAAFEPVDGSPLRTVASYCTPYRDGDSQLMVIGAVGSSLAVVSNGPPAGVASCDELRRDSAVLRASRGLRVVDEATWRAFMDEHGTLAPATTTTTTPPPTLDPTVVDYCDAIERFRGAGLGTIPGTGLPGPESLPYFEAVRDAAPPDIRPALETVIAWLEDGASTPVPPEVNTAAGAMTTSWIADCQLSTGATPSPTLGP